MIGGGRRSIGGVEDNAAIVLYLAYTTAPQAKIWGGGTPFLKILLSEIHLLGWSKKYNKNKTKSRDSKKIGPRWGVQKKNQGQKKNWSQGVGQKNS